MYAENGKLERERLVEGQAGERGTRYTQYNLARNSSSVKLFVSISFEWNGKVLKRSCLDGRNAGGYQALSRGSVMAKRKIFDELMEGVKAMKKHREEKVMLRSCKRRAQKQIAK